MARQGTTTAGHRDEHTKHRTDEADCGNLPGRLTTDGEHGVVLAALDRYVGGPSGAELPLPAESRPQPRPSHPDPGSPCEAGDDPR